MHLLWSRGKVSLVVGRYTALQRALFACRVAINRRESPARLSEEAWQHMACCDFAVPTAKLPCPESKIQKNRYYFGSYSI